MLAPLGHQHVHPPAGFAGTELPASWPCAGRAPELEPAPPPTPAAEFPVLNRSSQERTSHPQSVLCHREKRNVVWTGDVFMDGRRVQNERDRMMAEWKGTGRQRRRRERVCVGQRWCFDEEGDEALETSQVNFITQKTVSSKSETETDCKRNVDTGRTEKGKVTQTLGMYALLYLHKGTMTSETL